MALDLPRAVKRLGSRRRSLTLPAVFPTTAQETDLARIHMRVVRAWADEARGSLVPLYVASLGERRVTDGAFADSLDDLSAQVGASNATISRLIVTLTPELQRWTVRAEQLHRARFVAAVKTAAGVSLETILEAGAVETTVGAAFESNLSLIRNISDDMRQRIGRIVFDGFQQRTPRREVAKAINDSLGIGRKRALLIASDQTTKLSARLDQERQQEIGISQFVWRHSGKVHYRPHHKARDGKRYSWQKNNLNGDLPGVAINCGCKAQGYVPLD